MTKEEIKELCETWTEYLQCNSGSLHEGYMLNGDEVVYITDDAEVLESSEEKLIEDINHAFSEDFWQRDTGWLVNEFVEVLLGIEYAGNEARWTAAYNAMMQIEPGRREDYIKQEFMEYYDDPFKRADYLLQSVK